jgi:DNA-binding SARP family transcriptional activator
MQLELAVHVRLTQADGSSVALAPRDAALLAWLALEGPTSRARLASLLWPESSPDAARNTLRQRLFHLKKHCGEVVSGSDALRLADGVRHDLGDAERILGNLRYPDAPAFEVWLRAQRERSAGVTRLALESKLRSLETAGELAAALPVAEALLQLDALSEAAHRHVMRLHYLRGDRAAALLAFDRCEQTLKNEVGTRPSHETLALLQTIEQAHAHTWLPGQALPASALRPPQMIGRDDDLHELIRAWTGGQRFVVTAQAGAGKSRLLDALAEARTGTLLVRARPGDDKVPSATLERLVHRLGERWPTLGAVPQYTRFMAQLEGPREGHAPTVHALAPLVAELLRAARGQGLAALVLDDLQFADDASVDAWFELFARPALADLRFGFASRPDGDVAAARIAALSARSDTVTLPLQPLAAAALRPFVESLALPGVDGAAVAAALLRRIGGNPLHLLETIRHALEKHGHLRADKLEAPARVTELLEERLVTLAADGLLLVRIAAVAGSDFDPDLAAAVSRRDVLELADSWHALERQGLLDSRGFMHDLIGEAAHRLLPRPIARVLHARVAAHLAQHSANAGRLAHHLLCAGDDTAAVPHLAAAARQAWQLGRSRETRDAYEKASAIELTRGRPDAAFELLFSCSEAIEQLGPAEALEPTVEQLGPLTHTPTQQARLAFLRAVVLHHRGDHAGCLARLDEAHALALASGDRAVEAGCRYTLGFYAAHDERLHEAVKHLSAAVQLLRGVGREQRAMVIELSVHNMLLWTGQARLALELQRSALQRLLDAGASNMLATVLMRQADSELRLGRVDAARRTAGQALIALRGTDMMDSELAATTRAIAGVLRRCGRWAEALDIVGETQQRLGPDGDPEQWLSQALADIYLDLGRPDLAHLHIEAFATASRHSARLRQRAQALRWRYSLATGSGIDADAALGKALRSENLLQACMMVLVAGQTVESAATATQCAALIARCEAQGLREQLAPLYALQGWLLARDGDAPGAETSLTLAVTTIAQGELGAMTPVCLLWLARASRASGRPDAATDHAQRAARWLLERSVDAVPEGLRDSFLRRNPVHRELVEWQP